MIVNILCCSIILQTLFCFLFLIFSSYLTNVGVDAYILLRYYLNNSLTRAYLACLACLHLITDGRVYTVTNQWCPNQRQTAVTVLFSVNSYCCLPLWHDRPVMHNDGTPIIWQQGRLSWKLSSLRHPLSPWSTPKQCPLHRVPLSLKPMGGLWPAHFKAITILRRWGIPGTSNQIFNSNVHQIVTFMPAGVISFIGASSEGIIIIC